MDPQRLGSALGPDAVNQLSSKTGLDVGSLLPMLAAFLPQIINALTPDGKVPAGGAGGGIDIGNILAGLGGSARSTGAPAMGKSELSVGDIGSILDGKVAPGSALALVVRDDLVRRVATRAAGDAATRVRARAREVQTRHRHPVARPAEERPPQEERVERRLRVERVAAREPVLGLEIAGRQHLARRDERADPGGDRVPRRRPPPAPRS